MAEEVRGSETCGRPRGSGILQQVAGGAELVELESGEVDLRLRVSVPRAIVSKYTFVYKSNGKHIATACLPEDELQLQPELLHIRKFVQWWSREQSVSPKPLIVELQRLRSIGLSESVERVLGSLRCPLATNVPDWTKMTTTNYGDAFMQVRGIFRAIINGMYLHLVVFTRLIHQ